MALILGVFCCIIVIGLAACICVSFIAATQGRACLAMLEEAVVGILEIGERMKRNGVQKSGEVILGAGADGGVLVHVDFGR